MDSLQYSFLKRTVYSYSSSQKGCIVRYLNVVYVVVTFTCDEPLFLFWYDEYVVLSVLRRVSERCFCTNEDNFFQLLFVYCVWNYIVGRTLRCAAVRNSGTLYRALIIVQTRHFCSLRTVKRMATRWSMKTRVVIFFEMRHPRCVSTHSVENEYEKQS
jgi:hypothetical protein